MGGTRQHAIKPAAALCLETCFLTTDNTGRGWPGVKWHLVSSIKTVISLLWKQLQPHESIKQSLIFLLVKFQPPKVLTSPLSLF